MYIETISVYFTNCIWDQLHDTTKHVYQRKLLHYINAIAQSNNRLKVYENITHIYNKTNSKAYTCKQFINECIIEFFPDCILDSSCVYETFDKLMLNTITKFIQYILAKEIDIIVAKEKQTINCIKHKTKFVGILTVEINAFIVLLNGECKYSSKQVKKYIELYKHFKSELEKIKNVPKCDKCIQTTETY